MRKKFFKWLIISFAVMMLIYLIGLWVSFDFVWMGTDFQPRAVVVVIVFIVFFCVFLPEDFK